MPSRAAIATNKKYQRSIDRSERPNAARRARRQWHMHACRTLARAFNARTNALRHSATMPKNKRGGGKGGGAGPHHHHRGSKKTKSSSGARFHAAAATASGGGDAPAPPPAQDDALAAFTKWSIDRGFELHPNVSLVNDAAAVAGGAGGDGDGGGRHNAVYAVGAIAPGDALAVIPKAWCLTPSNSSISLVVPMDDLDDLEDAALVLAVMYERAMGEKSPWYPYFSILPSSEDLPCLWTDDKAEAWLEGTDVLSRIENDEPAMRYDHERIMETCRAHESSLRHFFPDKKAPAKVPADDDDDDDDDDETRSTKSAKSDDVDDEEGNGPRLVERRDGPAGYDAFLSAASIVASRAFHVDDEQGQGLVPIADLFNHAGGGREHVHFTGGKEPTPGLGYLTKIDPPVDARDPRAPPSGATPPPATYEEGNTDPGVNEIAGLRSTRDVDGVLTIDAVRAAGAGDELFNTFGDHGNALLLHKYGFCEWDNARGGVMIPREVLIGVLGEDVLDDAEDALDDHDYDSDADSEDAEDADEDMTSAGAAAAKAAGAFYTLVPIRPRRRGERRSLRTFAVVSLRPGSLAFNPRPRRLSTPLLTPLNSTPTFARIERP